MWCYMIKNEKGEDLISQGYKTEEEAQAAADHWKMLEPDSDPQVGIFNSWSLA